MMEWFFPATSMSDEVCPVSENEEMCVRSFEWSEVERTIEKAKLGKAPGLDGINVEMMRAVWRAIRMGDESV